MGTRIGVHPGSLYLSFQGTIRVGLAATSICEDAHTVLQSYSHSTVTLYCVYFLSNYMGLPRVGL